MELHTSFSGKKLKLAAAVVITATLLFSGIGCAKDVNPPVIQQSQMPEWVVEDETIDLSVGTADDKGVKEVYVQFDSGEKITLTKADSRKNGEEVANWEASFKLAPKDYLYSIVAEDKAGNKSDPKEGKIAVYSKDSLYVYAWNKGIDTYISQLLSLENNGTVDEHGKAFIDLVAKYPNAGELVSEIYAEILKLPDLITVDEKDIEAVEDILMVASNPEYKDAFESMLSEGIPDKRKYCSPLEALLWIAYSKEFDKPADNPLEGYSLEKMINEAWKNTSTSRNYKSDRWKNFDEVVARLNSPYLAYWYLKDNVTFLARVEPGSWHTAKELFDKKIGCCKDYSIFITYCLLNNGYYDDEFETHETNAAGSLIVMRLKGNPNKDDFNTGLKPGDKNYSILAGGHAVSLVKMDKKIYCFDATPLDLPIGPYNSINDVIDAGMKINCGSGVYTLVYTIAGDHPWDDTRDPLSKPLNQWIWIK